MAIKNSRLHLPSQTCMWRKINIDMTQMPLISDGHIQFEKKGVNELNKQNELTYGWGMR